MLKHDKETRKRGRQEQAEDAIAHLKRHRNRLAEQIPDFQILPSPAFLGSSFKWINSDDSRDETDGNCEMLPGQVLISPTKGWLQAG